MKLRALVAVLLAAPGLSVVVAPGSIAAPPTPSRSLASLPGHAAAAPPRILLVDDDWSDNNYNPADSRRSPSDLVFRRLVSEAAGGDTGAVAIEIVRTNANGPDIERLRTFSLVVWYTGASYGGNADNTSVLSIVDEKTVRRYLEETGGTVILVSPGYVSKVLGAGSSWEKASWPFLNEVLGLRGGKGLAQRFQPGTVTASDGTPFTVGKGSGAVETQFSAVNPDGATVVFTSALAASEIGEQPAPVATAAAYGGGRIVYVGFTFENLDAQDLAPAFRFLLTSGGVSSNVVASQPSRALEAPPTSGSGAVTVQVDGTPTSAVVRWTLPTETILNATPGITTATVTRRPPATSSPAASVTVERLVANAAPVRLRRSSPTALSAIDPGPLTPGQMVTYRVTLTNALGVAQAADATYTPPLPRDPAGLTGTQHADGSVVITWQAVPGAAGYQVSGTALPTAVMVRGATSWRSAPQGAGARQWRVATAYEPGGVLTAASSWPSVQTRFVPTAGAAFLSLPRGARGPDESAAHYRQQCRLIALHDCRAENLLLSSGRWHLGTWGEFAFSGGSRSTTRTYRTPYFPSAAFADLNDLGRGRRVGCAADIYSYVNREISTVCWAASHGPVLQPGATADGVALAQAAERFVDRNVTFSTIVITPRGAMFGVWTPPPPPWPANPPSEGPALGNRVESFQPNWWSTSENDRQPAWLQAGTWDVANLEPWQREALVAAVARPAYTTSFDSEGAKPVPQACLSCHGGRYDSASGLVQGASLLPLIPAELAFSSPLVRSRVAATGSGDFGGWPDILQNSEESIRLINQVICRSNPSPTIRERIQALYSGSSSTCGFPAGTRANDNAVPPGWSAQAGLYRRVVAPYCGSCHFAQTGPYAFGSWGSMLRVKDAVQRTVCREFTMPHSEIGFRRFWSEGGAVSLPGLLSTSLGFANCPG